MDLLQERRPSLRSTGNGFFLWSVERIVLTGLCFASWLGSFYVVQHPENPKCYGFLKKFKRIDPPKRYEVTEAPKGDFLSATRLLDRYGKLGKLELANENKLLLRDYVMNFRESRRRVPYLAGRYEVVQSYPLTKGDVFPSGAVAVAQAENVPQVLVEFVFPAAPEDVGVIRETVAMGADIALQRSHDLWAVLHVERHADGRMQFTVVPLPYGGWQLKGGQGSFKLRSPEELLRDFGSDLNLAAGFPLVRDPRLAQSLTEHKAFRRKMLARAGEDQAALSGPELVRIEPDAIAPAETADPAAGGQHQAAQPGTAQRAQVARPVPTPAPAVPLPPRPIVRAKSTPAIIGAAVPTPAPAAVAAAQQPAAVAAPASARALTTPEVSSMVEKYSKAQPATLTGDFVVTGVLGRRVALRTVESLRDANADPTRPGGSAALIVVEYPEGAAIPEKDASFSRDAVRGFVVNDVIRGRNGQITIVASDGAAE